MSQAGALEELDEAPDRADLATLHSLALAPLPFEHRGLRKMRIIKNMRLETVVELFAGATGSGQATIKSIAKGFELESGNDLHFCGFWRRSRALTHIACASIFAAATLMCRRSSNALTGRPIACALPCLKSYGR